MLKNSMEEVVIYVVNVMLKEVKNDFWKNSIHKNDLVCYVLNRIKPKYVTSGRGVIYSESELEKNLQEHVDIFSLTAKGMRTIQSRRQNYEVEDVTINEKDEGYYFYFPCFVGKIISLDTLGDIHGIEVKLKRKIDNNYETVSMMSPLWHNPYIISDKTSGYYTFYPKPIRDDSDKPRSHTFELLVIVNQPNYEESKKFFEIKRTSEKIKKVYIRKEATYRIENFYISKGKL